MSLNTISPLKEKQLLLIIGGGIAAYKCLDLIRRVKERGMTIRTILTPGGEQFVTALSISGLSGEKVYTDIFSLTDETEMGHIRLSREADIVLVAPATADMMAKMASGIADNLATTALLATDKPVMIAPSMNSQMWTHKATQRNLAQLIQDGIQVIQPGNGGLACGEEGAGRLAEIPDIIQALEEFFAPKGPLLGKHIIITAGPTYEAIDPVRYIANRSSGKQGYAIARALSTRGARVTLISGPTNLTAPDNIEVINVQSAQEMLDATLKTLPAEVVLCVAAVSDWRIPTVQTQKIKKRAGAGPTLTLTENPDILKTLSEPSALRANLVIGFAAETENMVENAIAKLKRKGCDWIVANDVSTIDGKSIMGGDYNKVSLITATTSENWAYCPKNDVAERLADKIENHFK